MSAWLRHQALAQPPRRGFLRELVTLPFAAVEPPVPEVPGGQDDGGSVQAPLHATASPPASPLHAVACAPSSTLPPSTARAAESVAAASASATPVLSAIAALRRDLQRVGCLVLVVAFGVALLHGLPALRWLLASP